MKKISIILILLLSINTFGAIVSDNDGSAFVTKAEFEALKISFNKQIDEYNASIDGKIDGAIAAYLAGINISELPTNYIDKLNSSTANGFRFINKIDDVGQATITTDTTFNVAFDIYKQVPIVYPLLRSVNNDTASGIYYDLYASAAQRAKIDNIYNLFGNSATGAGVPLGNAWTSASKVDITKVDTKMENKSSTTTSKASNGSGKVWEYYKKANGNEKITSFNTKYYPLQNITYNIHWYQKYWTKGDNNIDTLRNYLGTESGGNVTLTTGKETVNVDSKDTWGTYPFGDTKEPTDSTTNSFSGTQQLTKMQAKTTDDWELLQISNNVAATEIFCIDQNKKLTVATSQATETMSNVTFEESYYVPTGSEQTRKAKVTNITFKYYPVSYSTEKKKLNNFVNDTLTSIVGEIVHLGSGIPLASVVEEGKIKCTLVFALENASGASANGDIEVKISNKQFANGDFATGTDVKRIVDETLTISSGGTVTKEYTIDCENKEMLWINVNPQTSGNKVWIKSATIVLTS